MQEHADPDRLTYSFTKPPLVTVLTLKKQLINRGPERAPEELRDEESSQKETVRREREVERGKRGRGGDGEDKWRHRGKGERGDKMAQLERGRGCHWQVPL